MAQLKGGSTAGGDLIITTSTNVLKMGVFYENDQLVDCNYTLSAGKNAMSAGPLVISDGVTITIPDGASWSIV